MRTRLLIIIVLLCGSGITPTAQEPLAGPLFRAIVAAGVPIVSVSVATNANKATWKVQPADLQDEAQPTIDSFDPNDATLLAAELDMEAQRIAAPRWMRAWVLFYLRDTLGRNPTLAERQAARDALIQAYKDVGP